MAAALRRYTFLLAKAGEKGDETGIQISSIFWYDREANSVQFECKSIFLMEQSELSQ